MKHRIGNGTQARNLLRGLQSGITIPRLFKCNTSIGVIEPVHGDIQLCELTDHALRLLMDERYHDAIYNIRVSTKAKKIELICDELLTECRFTEDVEEQDDDYGSLIGSMMLSDFFDTDTPGDIVLSRNMDDDVTDDEIDACHQPILQFVISKTKATDGQLKVGITTLVNRITDRSVSTDIKGVCIVSCLKDPELSTPGTYEVSVRCRFDDDSDEVGVKLTIVRLQDDHRFVNYRGSTTIGVVEEKPSLDEILDYLQDGLSGDDITETNLGDDNDQADLIRAIQLLA